MEKTKLFIIAYLYRIAGWCIVQMSVGLPYSTIAVPCLAMGGDVSVLFICAAERALLFGVMIGNDHQEVVLPAASVGGAGRQHGLLLSGEPTSAIKHVMCIITYSGCFLFVLLLYQDYFQ